MEANDSRSINSQFQGATDAGIVANMKLRTAKPVTNWDNVGFGLQMDLPYSLKAFLDYEALFMQNTSNHMVSGQVTFEF
ncbi:MAG TPA: hypothetical protein VLU73_06535 [Methylococcaceae bacterium]|jgi:hypothetical protein|nr:hypothetical protein [Methylococcaceae bacterium]